MCATNPARELGLTGHGALVAGGAADVAVLNRRLQVVRTFVGGVAAPAAGGDGA
jgi:N-acetylglucosamine-6-phosphate deacetylase